MYKVKSKFKDSVVLYRVGPNLVRIPKLSEATQEQLEILANYKHPGVIKERQKTDE